MEILNFIAENPLPSILIMIAAGFVIACIVAVLQGREVSLLPPRIGGRPYKLESGGPGLEIFDAVRLRKSVRSYTGQKVEREKLEKLMEAARLAPSASNRQEWRFMIVDDDEVLKRIAGASCIGAFIKNAPCVILACAETDEYVMQGGQKSYPIDVAIALDHLSLAAVGMGLGTCWIGMYDEAKVKQIAGIPKDVRLVCLMALGYPKDPSAVEKKRLPLEKIMKYNHW